MLMEEILKERGEADANGCMNWLRAKNQHGYGRVYYEGRVSSAHRAIWKHFNGSIPDGMCVLHKCDNTSCCNEKHLFLGTQLDNMRDMVSNGRHVMCRIV